MDSYEIPRHKVFISYHQKNDLAFKDELIHMTEWNPEKHKSQSMFENCSVCQDDVGDKGKTDEQVRRIIRRDYIKDATVLILLCGKETANRKFVDWEIDAAMSDENGMDKMGILVINLPSIYSDQHTNLINTNGVGVVYHLGKSFPIEGMSEERVNGFFPCMPDRIKGNMVRKNVRIPVVNWSEVEGDALALKGLIDDAFNYRAKNTYDHSTPLRKRNS